MLKVFMSGVLLIFALNVAVAGESESGERDKTATGSAAGKLAGREYPVRLGGVPAVWGYYLMKTGICDAPLMRVEYLYGEKFDPQSSAVVYYSPYPDAMWSLLRDTVYPFATEDGALLFTFAFNSMDSNLHYAWPDGGNIYDGWNAAIIREKKKLETAFGMPARKFFVFGESAGARDAINIANRHPDAVAAVAWCTGAVQPVADESTVPTLAVTTWGDRENLTADWAKKTSKNGRPVVFLCGPPSWREKGYSNFHHGPNDFDYLLPGIFQGASLHADGV